MSHLKFSLNLFLPHLGSECLNNMTPGTQVDKNIPCLHNKG